MNYCTTINAMVRPVTITTVSHSKNLVILPTAYFFIIILSLAMMAINTKRTGKIKPPINCEVNMISIKPISGSKTIITEKIIMKVNKNLNVGASFHLNETPASQPKASQTTKAVVSGNTQAAKNDAATKPTPNNISAYSPAKGANALAASCAVSTVIP